MSKKIKHQKISLWKIIRQINPDSTSGILRRDFEDNCVWVNGSPVNSETYPIQKGDVVRYYPNGAGTKPVYERKV